MIINKAIKIEEWNKIEKAATGVIQYEKSIVVVGKFIDFLVLLNLLNSESVPTYFVKAGADNVGDSVY